MIEIKRRRIADLKVGEKFSYNGYMYIKIEGGSVWENNIETIDDGILPPYISFKDIALWEIFLSYNKVYIKTGAFGARDIEECSIYLKFDPDVQVFRVKELELKAIL